MQAAIARGARATGTSFDFLLAQARLESSLDPSAKATTSSASGLFQFIESTWLATVDRHGARHGLDWASNAIERGDGRFHVSDPGLRAQIMALRHDPVVASVMAGALAQDNRAALRPVLSREPDAAELYLAHFLGAGGASTFLARLQADPASSAAALLPEAASANRSIFYSNGTPRSLDGVMDLIRAKVHGAMAGGGAWADVSSPARTISGPPLALAPAARPSAPEASRSSGLPSMAATLDKAFGLHLHNSGNTAPAHVHAAYGKLKAFGL